MDLPEIPGYQISKPLGKGGMAVVYLAVQANFERQVALKIMASHLVADASFGERFLREARIVAQLSHQNIVPVYDVGQYQDYHYMAMEYLPGGDLKAKLKKGVTLSEGINIIKAIASGLDYAHRKNFIHRDIKPENILFREEGSPVISDFGIARNTESETRMTMTGTVIGSPHYMSPEQAEAAPLDGRTDLYSLGIILYELLTGAVPFSGESAISIGIKHITAQLPPLPPEMAEFQEFIDTALAKDREDRFQTGAEFRQALEEIAFGLSDTGAATVVVTREEMAMGSSAANSKNRSGARVSRSSKAPRPSRNTGDPRLSAPPRPPEHTRSTSKVALVLSVLALGSLAAVGGWYYTTQFSPGDQNTRTVSQPILTDKEQALLDNAQQAIQDRRLYSPAGDNAQHYLTTLLALSPDLQEAKQAIENLFRRYLTEAETAITSNRLDEANNYLNQSSQLTFYIQQAALLEQQRQLRTRVIAARQQQIIVGDRREEVAQMLTNAANALVAGRLIAPEDDNAYGHYQRALTLDPRNTAARDGIRAVADALLGAAEALTAERKFDDARRRVADAALVLPSHPGLADAQQAIAEAEGVAQAEQEQARQEREAKIAALKTDIAEAIEVNRLTLPAGSSALDHIRELQALDPGNRYALDSLQQLVAKLAELGRIAIGAGDLDTAERHLTLAQELAPGDAKLAAVQQEFRAEQERRAQLAAVEKARRDAIAQAVTEARQAFAAKNPVAALDQLRKALELDAGHETSLALRQQVLTAAYGDMLDHMDAGELDAAETLLNGLARHDADAGELARLRARLEEEREVAEFANSEEGQLMFKAAELEQINRNDKLNTELRAIYQRLIAINPDERSYRHGLGKTSDYEARLGHDALKSRDFGRVRTHLDIIKIATPEHASIATLEADLNTTISAQNEASTKLDEARAQISTPYEKPGIFGSNNQARQIYLGGYQAIEAARGIDSGHPELETVFRELETRYAEIIAIHLADEHYNEAGEFIDDYQSFNWLQPSTEMQALLDEYNREIDQNASQ